MKYPLAPLLKLRKNRTERCEQALAHARQVTKQRRLELDQARDEHLRYQAWCDAEEDRIFTELFAAASPHHKLLEAREEMLANRAREAHYLQQISDAETALNAAVEEEARTLAALHQAIRESEKLLSHESNWKEATRAAEQLAEDAVMEESSESAYLRSRAEAEQEELAA